MQHIKLVLLGLFLFSFMPLVDAQNGLNFDGINDYVQTNYSGIAGNSSRTIEAWIKTTKNSLPAGQGGQGQSVIVDWGTLATSSRFTFCILFNNAIRIEVQGNGLNGTIPVNDGNWHHVAAVYNSSASNTYSLYVDGVLDISGNLTVGTNTGTSVALRLGVRVDDVNYFQGSMDEVRVWNYARTQAQIQANMNVEYCASASGLVAYHKFNQGVAGQPNTSVNISNDGAQGNNGSLQNFTLNGTSSNWIVGQALTTLPINISQTLAECTGYSITIGANTYATTGIYVDTLTSVSGCDSIITTDLAINTPPAAFNQTFVECAGYSVVVGANTYTTTTGIYTDTLVGMSVNGCDSIVSTDLSITPSASFSQTVVECAGYSITVGTNTYTTTGVYTNTLVGMAMNGCDSIVTTDLTVNAAIDLTTTVTGMTISANMMGATYQWLDCTNGNMPLVGETGQNLNVTANGDYAVVLTVGNCSDTSACVNITGVGFTPIEVESVVLSPNPTTAWTYLTQNNVVQIIQIQVIDVMGKVIFELETNEKQTPLDLRTLSAGLYFIKIRYDNKEEIVKVVKH
jgi:hypothetical protein